VDIYYYETDMSYKRKFWYPSGDFTTLNEWGYRFMKELIILKSDILQKFKNLIFFWVS
jgi:hypothetical protein